MIAQSRTIAAGAVTLAFVAHFSAVQSFFQMPDFQIEGGAETAVARLGNSFADFVQGSVGATEVDDVTEVAPPDTTVSGIPPDAPSPPTPTKELAQQPVPETTTRPTPVVEAAQPEQTPITVASPAPTPLPTEITLSPDVLTTNGASPSQIPAIANPEAVLPLAAAALAPRAPVVTLGALSPASSPTPPQTQLAETPTTKPPVKALRPEPPKTVPTPAMEGSANSPSSDTTKVVTAIDLTSPAVLTSPKPRSRPANLEIPAAATPKPPKPLRPVPTPARAGNSTRNAAAGSDDGSTTATATISGRVTGAPTTASGNAAASNYPGKVMRRISRVPRPKSRHKGAAVIGFSVASNGGLASVYVASSSGSAELDNAATTVVRRAAPFPPPPPGARRSFSVRIRGR